MRFAIRSLANLGVLCLLTVSATISAQFQRTELNFVCPCTLTSQNGITAELNFTLVNYTEKDFEDLHVTVGISGMQQTESGTSTQDAAFLDTVALGFSVQSEATHEDLTYSIELGDMPVGDYYFELLLHRTETVSFIDTLDAVWFKGRHASPVTTIALEDANYLLDTDDDGVADLNEELEGTDPFDASSYPSPPLVDILILHEDATFEHYNVSPELFIAHVVAATNDMYERSDSQVRFRAVGSLGTDIVPGIRDGESLDTPEYQRLLEEYDADLVLVFRARADLCGFAVSIGGENDKGFLHPNERFAYTEVFLDPLLCSLDTTAHEIGHLMGLGHAFAQQSVGTYPWSRGHAVQGEFGTIMSYAEIVFQAIGLDVFSNPRSDCHGKPCGIDHTAPNHEGSADSALSLNVLKYQFARTGTPSNNLDVDQDGVGAVDDAFPIDPAEWSDRDGDQYGDNSDAFPDDPFEWIDTDGDGIGNNTDPDIDNDGINNVDDFDPFNATVQSSRIVSIESHEELDYFGSYTVRINDLDADGTGDLATTAPYGRDQNNHIVGKVYLFSYEDLVNPTIASSTTPGIKQLDELIALESTWVLHGVTTSSLDQITDYGTFNQLLHVAHTEDHHELWLTLGTSMYLITLSSEALREFDVLDGDADRQISLDYCLESSACTRLDTETPFVAASIASIPDLDDDNLRELVVAIESYDEAIVLYVLNRDSVQTINVDEETGELTIEALFEQDERNHLLITSGELALDGIKDRSTHPINPTSELTLGIYSSNEDGEGRVYIVNVDQLAAPSSYDPDGDRTIDIDDLVGAGQTRRITHGEQAYFGLGVASLTDIDDDEDQELFVSGYWGLNYAIGSAGMKALDFLDFNFDGAVRLGNTSEQARGIWFFNQFFFNGALQGSAILPSEIADSADVLVTRRSNSLLVASLSDFDFLDDPTGVDYNGIINLPIRIRYPEVYLISVPIGPRGFTTFHGIGSLGDLDGDDITDFVFSVTSTEIAGVFSRMYVVPSSALDALDRADGNIDSLVALSNNMEDTDNDGILNLHDDDDDGDGLVDFFDEYPLYAEYQYDADGDGFANGLDLYPLRSRWHSDIDNDGLGDRVDDDIDGDGILNDEDEYPEDTDNDGYQNQFDFDDDNDGYIDIVDAFPLDPTEWLDTDGDGFGDNSDFYPNDPEQWLDPNDSGQDEQTTEAFASYALLGEWTDWSEESFNVSPGTVFGLGDFDRDGSEDLEIANALPHEEGQPMLILSSADLPALDELDESKDQRLDLNRIHEGPNSWRLTNSDASYASLRFSGAAVGDLNGDDLPELMIFNPDANDSTGVVTSLLGGIWSDLDGLGDSLDGVVDLALCVENGYCNRIAGSYSGQRFGLSGGLIFDTTTEQWSLLVGTGGPVESSSDQFTHAAAFVLPSEVVQEGLANATQLEWTLDDLVDGNSLAFFLSDELISAAERKLSTSRFVDYDKDGIDDIAFGLTHSDPAGIQLYSSSDLRALATQDSEEKPRLVIDSVSQLERSYWLNGLEMNAVYQLADVNTDESSLFMSLFDRQSNADAWIVDMSQIDEIDRGDGEIDRIVEDLTADGTSAWRFAEARTLKLCKADASGDRMQGLASTQRMDGSTNLSDALSITVFDATALGALANLTSDSEGTIDLTNPEAVTLDATWSITFGELTVMSSYASVHCAGDFDGDGYQDFAVTLHDHQDEQTRLQILLIAYADLARLDELDGEQDSMVDVSLVWAD